MRIPKITFKNLFKSSVVIFDNEGTQVLQTTVLNGIEFTILHCRKEMFHITLPLLYLMIRNAIIFIRKKSLNLNSAERKSTLLVCIYKIYLFSCIEYINPRVVVTFIDNKAIFHWISRMYKNCEFYAVQNGMRYDAKRLQYEKQDEFGERPIRFQTDVMSMPNLFCFGAYETELYKEHGHVVDNFYPVGSLKAGFYKTCIARDKAKLNFDICLVSNGFMSLPEGHKLSKFELVTEHFYKLINKYVTEKRMSCCVAMRSTDKHDQEIEKECFANIFGDRATIIGKKENDMFTTYAAMDRSSVVVALCSTAAFEAFGWGKKILFCNLFGDDYWQSPLPEICTMNVNDYEIFTSKLNYLRQLDENEYRKIIQSHARYLMNYNFENPAHTVIRKMILDHLN
jgi:surface carbohydrate biosynthesis protein